MDYLVNVVIIVDMVGVMTRTVSKRDNVETMNRKLSRNQSVIEKQTRYKK